MKEIEARWRYLRYSFVHLHPALGVIFDGVRLWLHWDQFVTEAY